MSQATRPWRVYLDTADIHRIADGKAAPHDQTLRAAIAETGARVVCSVAHLFDLVDADDATVARWSQAVAWLGPAEWIAVEGDEAQFEPYSTADVAPRLTLVRKAIPTVRALRHAGAEAAHDAYEADNGRRVSKKELRANAAAFLDGPLGGLFGWIGGLYGLTREEMLAKVGATSEDALARGHVVDAVHRQLDDDRGRRPLISDMADSMHLNALPHVQVFTADRYTSTKIEQTLRRAGGDRPLARRVPVFHLDTVAEALRDAARFPAP